MPLPATGCHLAAHATPDAAFGRGVLSMARFGLLLLLVSACAGCGGSQYGGGFDGRRGYDGNGDYGYDLAASRAEARGYRSRAARAYPAPGPADDPWGPYIRQAAARHQVPERWIREVMRQESGGRLQAADGTLTTSGAGAMGLMQVMPSTYDILRQRYGLGDDPYEPRDNILAGTAYIREMYDRFGAPAFLAAYNAGPNRLDAYLAGTDVLPDETVNYLANVAPRLGTEVAMTGPLSVYAGGSAVAADTGWRGRTPTPTQIPTQTGDADRAYAGGGMLARDYAAASDRAGEEAVDPADRAFDGGGLVTADAPTGLLTGRSGAASGDGYRAASGDGYRAVSGDGYRAVSGDGYRAVSGDGYRAVSGDGYRAASGDRSGAVVLAAASAQRGLAGDPVRAQTVPVATLLPVMAPGTGGGAWGIQVGAFPDPATSRAAIAAALARAGRPLAGSQPAVMPVQRAALLYRARLTGLSADNALAACTVLQREGLGCFTVPPGS